MEARNFVSTWAQKTGSWAIANATYLRNISIWADSTHRFVDYGAGIGTVTYWFDLNSSEVDFLAIEPDLWCRQELAKNTSAINNLRIAASLSELSISELRGALWSVDMAFAPGDISLIVASEPKLIFVEGHRFKQRFQITLELIRSGKGFDYESFRCDTNSGKGGCFFIVGGRIDGTAFPVLASTLALFLAFRSLHILVRLAQFLGLKRKAKNHL
jgi:hypothetical protein